MKKRNNDMKRRCRDIKKIIWMKWRLLTFTKRCNKKARKLSKSKKALSKSDKPKKVSGLIDDPSEKGQKPKKASGDGKKTTTKTGKKIPHSLKSTKVT